MAQGRARRLRIAERDPKRGLESPDLRGCAAAPGPFFPRAALVCAALLGLVACGKTKHDGSPSAGATGGLSTGGTGSSQGGARSSTGVAGSLAGGAPSAGGAAGTPTGLDPVCAALGISVPAPAYATQYIVDRSASMDTPLRGSDLARLGAVSEALLECSLAGGQNALWAFPDGGGCVDVGASSSLESGREHFVQHTAALTTATSNAAPLIFALEDAYEALSTLDPEVNKRIVLFTDGGLEEPPFCEDAQPDSRELAELTREAGIAVVVVGLPGSDADATRLADLAEMFGCTDPDTCYHDLSQLEDGACAECRLCELADPRPTGLDHSCSFVLDVTGDADFDAGEVVIETYDARSGEEDTRVLTTEEFSIQPGEPASLELSPEVCDLVENLVRIEASFPCR